MMPEPGGPLPDADLNVLLVVYELADIAPDEKEPDTYSRIVETIRSHPNHARLTHSAWLIETSATPADVLDSLVKDLARTDRVFVAALTGELAWRNVADDFEWLSRHLAPPGPRPGGPPTRP